MSRPCCERDREAQRLRDMAPSEFDAWKTRLERNMAWLDVLGGIAAFVAAVLMLALLGATWVNAFRP